MACTYDLAAATAARFDLIESCHIPSIEKMCDGMCRACGRGRRDLVVAPGGAQTPGGERREIVAVDQVVERAGMLGHLRQDALEDARGLQMPRVALVGGKHGDGLVQREGVEHRRLGIRRVARVELLHRLLVLDDARAVRHRLPAPVVDADGRDVVALALGLARRGSGPSPRRRRPRPSPRWTAPRRADCRAGSSRCPRTPSRSRVRASAMAAKPSSPAGTRTREAWPPPDRRPPARRRRTTRESERDRGRRAPPPARSPRASNPIASTAHCLRRHGVLPARLLAAIPRAPAVSTLGRALPYVSNAFFEHIIHATSA